MKVRVVLGLPPSEENTLAITNVINQAYGYTRTRTSEISKRLRAHTNRVLHVATVDGRVVGACSSTLHVPWCTPGCGHWGMLAVVPEAQGQGVASALVAAAEHRLLAAGLSWAAIEYSYNAGEAQSERMVAWYEDALGYAGPTSRRSGFRMCRKNLRGSLDDDPAAKVNAAARAGSTSAGRLGGSIFLAWLVAVLRWLFCGLY
jgi:GNAT superfamily N-acetyltransferase